MCPTADEVTLAIGKSVPDLHPQAFDGALNCTYINDANLNGPAVNITFGGSAAKVPAAAAAAWKDAIAKGAPGVVPVLVPGIGDGAIYNLAKGGYPAFNFISNGFTCNIYMGKLTSDQAHLTKLAKVILAG